jgi:hypothetical protein
MSPSRDIKASPDALVAEVARYEAAFLATRRVLDEAIRNLAVLKALATDFDERDEIGLELAELKSERTDLARANVAFHAHKATMVPPSAEQVGALRALADQAVQLTQQRASISATLRIATSALNKFGAIQDIG